MLRLYDYLDSGNGYKVRLLLAQLGRTYDRIELDIMKGETRTPDFLAKNPIGRIPLLELDNGRFLAESNAILFYLAQGTPYLPTDAFLQAKILSWMCFEQYNHEPYIAVLRHWTLHMTISAEQEARVPELKAKGEAALQMMDDHLTGQDYFVAGAYSIADIALYAYTHVAADGGFDLSGYPALQAWIARVKRQAGYVPITQG
ncbi:MAG: glutathione S-transferase family protein [Pseudomonadota bacterium]